ncbi:MAG: DbpA RNA binding domain-containing protein [Gemmatimonadales bacterium]
MSDLGRTTPPVSGKPFTFGAADAIPLAQRGNSVVFAAPPSPAYSVPLIAASLAATPDTDPRPVLLIAPDAAWSAWIDAGHRAARSVGKRSAAGSSAARAKHHLQGGEVALVVTNLAVVDQLLQQSALVADRLGAIILAWPELEANPDAFTALFAEVPKETPRVLLTADPARSAPLAERYAWRAPLMGSLGEPTEMAPPRFRIAATGWRSRPAALAALADLSDKDEVTVWTADDSDHAAIEQALAAHGTGVVFTRAVAMERTAVWCYDAPPAALLAAVDPAGSVLLVPPGVESYVARFIKRADPVPLPTPAEVAGQAIVADRKAIKARLAAGPDRGAFATVAPLLDQFSAAEVAVALQALWTEARTRAVVAATPAIPEPRKGKTSRVWAGAGKKDGVTLSDWIGLLTSELKIPRQSVGRVEIRDTFTILEFGSEDDAKVAVSKLAGQTLKRRRLTVRIDQGPGGRSAGPR